MSIQIQSPTKNSTRAEVRSPAAGDASQAGLVVVAQPELWNGSTWDPQPGNMQGTLLASATRTATATSPTQTNVGARGVVLYLNVTATSGTGGLKVRVGAVDPVSGAVRLLTQDTVFRTTTGLFVGVVYPGGANSFVEWAQSSPLPRVWYADVVHNDASSYTYSLGYALVL